MADFCVNLKRLRKSEGLSQDLLAEKLGVSRQTISSWERGNSYPDLDMLVQISEALHTTPNQLLYPPTGSGKQAADQIITDSEFSNFFGKLALVVFIVGFLWGISEGSAGYPWHFVFSRARNYWIAAFLTGMVFIGMKKIIALLLEIKDRE